MNILLVKPGYPYPYSRGEDTYNRIWPPLCLANCAALLEKAGHTVKILDAHAEAIKPVRMGSYARGYDKIFISSSSLDRWQCPNIDISYFADSARSIRRLTDEIYVMGYHGTVDPERILNLTGAKAVIRGEPEYATLEICQNHDLFGIKGLSFKEGGGVSSTPQREPIDLASLPVPAFHLLDFKKYFYEILGNNFSLFETSRGCKFKCRFCNKTMYGQGIRTKTKDQLLEELALAIEKYNVKTGYFIDLDFISNREFTAELCEHLIRKQYRFKWACQTRPDHLDRKILSQMKRSGCKIIHLGIETGIQGLLDYFNKNISVDVLKKAVRLCREVGIKTFAFFLFGLAEQTDADKDRIYSFITELNADFVSFHKIQPYPGSDIYKDNLVFDENIDNFIAQIYLRYYLRPAYLLGLELPVALNALRLFLGRLRTLR